MPFIPAPNCEGCRFWRELEPEQPTRIAATLTGSMPGREGECRPAAPGPAHAPDRKARRTFWPITKAEDWCGTGQAILSVPAESGPEPESNGGTDLTAP